MKPLVYLVEDDEFLVNALAAQLEDLGCKATILPDAASLISKKGKAPDFVITDLHIPSGSRGSSRKTALGTPLGLDALRRVRRKSPKSRLALITGMPSLDAQKWCGKNSASYLLKPVPREALERFLGRRKIR